MADFFGGSLCEFTWFVQSYSDSYTRFRPIWDFCPRKWIPARFWQTKRTGSPIPLHMFILFGARQVKVHFKVHFTISCLLFFHMNDVPQINAMMTSYHSYIGILFFCRNEIFHLITTPTDSTATHSAYTFNDDTKPVFSKIITVFKETQMRRIFLRCICVAW